jgi:uncharacterized protein (TIGR03435 family)
MAQQPRPAFDAFEVATIKPAAPEPPGRYTRMLSAHRFIAKNYSLKYMIGAAYNLPQRAISGAADWMDTEHFDVMAGTPGAVQPDVEEQMKMLRALLAERFQLKFHREPKEMPVYVLSAVKTGAQLKESEAPADAQPQIVGVVHAYKEGGVYVEVPARNATVAQFAGMLQRAVLDRPVVDKTGLTGRYDFDLEWTPDESQYGGAMPVGSPENPKPDLYAAVQSQLGLKLEATRALFDTFVIDRAEKPSQN